MSVNQLWVMSFIMVPFIKMAVVLRKQLSLLILAAQYVKTGKGIKTNNISYQWQSYAAKDT